ncbi:L-ascorbate metabolism protein UlaG (beta-lactamase superfamily) [Rubricella aquisinus]|uniref:L-ascorbate metabolism protein UlaG (Beta-lactamase superfamily) n=1 Tax=Rubricella aquisinus TaxID=2028108 RepID=A0A840WYX8_9RHOB|nr:MBL fold metallo-hydrolase [Rubricella aquisinus]MBB5515614.1 L-ascorbate metabolism protein UlaG (beta-lactamase superfamily) [Rubricella aquisinus]
MKIHQIRNATILVEYDDVRLLVDPMLARKGAFPTMTFLKAKGRNPTVDLPEGAMALMETATHCLITHCRRGHFDHFDTAAKRWLRKRQIPVFCTPRDMPFLKQKGLNVVPLKRDDARAQGFLTGTIQTTPCRHGRGIIGPFMEHGAGYLIKQPGEPSLYLTGDTLLTEPIKEIVRTQTPDVIVAPAGDARFDIGGPVIMGVADMIALARLTPGVVVANHLGAINHCLVTRDEVASAAERAGLGNRICAPDDGATLTFESRIKTGDRPRAV